MNFSKLYQKGGCTALSTQRQFFHNAISRFGDSFVSKCGVNHICTLIYKVILCLRSIFESRLVHFYLNIIKQSSVNNISNQYIEKMHILYYYMKEVPYSNLAKTILQNCQFIFVCLFNDKPSQCTVPYLVNKNLSTSRRPSTAGRL